MTIDFYYNPGSGPCRTLLIAAKTFGVEWNKIVLNLMAKEQLKPEFLKLNPQHTVPTMVDDGFVLTESRAILIYLAEKFDKEGKYYPKCMQKRTLVLQRLMFDLGTLNKAFGDYFYPQMREGKPADPAALAKIHDALQYLNIFLEGQTYLVGDSPTIADMAIATTVSTFEAVNIDIKKYANIVRWYDQCKTVLPGWNENAEGIVMFRNFLKNLPQFANL